MHVHNISKSILRTSRSPHVLLSVPPTYLTHAGPRISRPQSKWRAPLKIIEHDEYPAVPNSYIVRIRRDVSRGAFMARIGKIAAKFSCWIYNGCEATLTKSELNVLRFSKDVVSIEQHFFISLNLPEQPKTSKTTNN